MTCDPRHDSLDPGLYIVATPIGNLGDITMRAIDVLTRCDAIACEDTRVTGKLLKHLDISNRLLRYNDHSDAKNRESLIAVMRDQAIALVSDAGTPLISDPGYRLVQDARESGIRITSLPGPCAAVTALTQSGLPSDSFLFAGFIPKKEQARGAFLRGYADIGVTLVFYETGPRLLKSLASISEMMPGRTVSVARELTKLHEECRTNVPEELIGHYTSHPPKGEIVLMVGPRPEVDAGSLDVDALLLEALEENKASKAAGIVAKMTGQERKALYERALKLRGK